MGRKSKKRRQQQQAHSVLHSLKDLRGDARDTLSRLATTVRAETPTLSLGSGKLGGALNSLYKSPIGDAGPSHATRLSSFAAKLNPLTHARAAYRRASTNRKLAQISSEMSRGGYSMQPVRRSRLPYVMAFFVALLGFGGWYVYESVDLPDMPLAEIEKHLDYKKWLAAVGGYDNEGEGQASSSETRRAESQSKPRVQASPGAAGGSTSYSSSTRATSGRYTSIATGRAATSKSSYRGKGMTVRSSSKGTKGRTISSRGAASTKAKSKYASSKSSSRRGKAAYASSKSSASAKAKRSGSKVASSRGKSSKAKLATSRSSAKSSKAKAVRTGYRRR
jgi:hypothetical protein